MNLRSFAIPSASRAFAVLVVLAGRAAADDPAGPKISFDRDIRPLLSDTCFACHGPDEAQRKAGLRLDTREGAFGELESGGHAIVAGQPDESDIVFRLEIDDDELRMPPKTARKQLTDRQIKLIRDWVAQGANWSTHWAFVTPTRPELPPVQNASWPFNGIDHFILARLEKEGLKPSPEADKTTLIRRVTLDLTGLPPTPAEVDAFLNDSSPQAYERLVDRLLDSPRYGEHMARYWLDAARYGDTHGLHLDNYREAWPYRDWVIDAFNANKRFDQFIVEQLAGDLLPNATPDQIIATGYNRCHVSTNEGGSIVEEVYVRNVVDQVDTNGTVFLGLTIGCARCHDHKYDPVRMKDYYSLFAFFNNIDGSPMDGNAEQWAPVIQVPTAEQTAALKAVDARIAGLKQSIKDAVASVTYDASQDALESEVVQRADYVWFDDALLPGAKAEGDAPWELVGKPDHPVQSGEKALLNSFEAQGQRFFTGAARKLKVGLGDTLFAYVFLDPLKPPKEIMIQWHTGGTWSHRAFWGDNVIDYGKDGSPERRRFGDLPPPGEWARLEVPINKLGMKPGTVIDGLAFTQHGGNVYWDKAGARTWTPQAGQFHDTLTSWIRARKADNGAGLSKPLQEALKLDRSKRSDDQNKQLIAAFIENGYSGTRAALEPLQAQLAAAEGERKTIDEAIPTSLVFREKPGEPKAAFILNRGEYDQKRDQVGRATPAFLPPLPEGAPLDRLGLARWLVAAEHPLTARVAVNRFWQQLLGTGIVKTAEDFGSQGERPSHPDLLDWLAVTFREEGWNVKDFLKRIVMSSTYRQTARVTPEQLAKDPENRLYARGPRFRLDAEVLRDQALFVSGLLVEQLGGPSVKPPQPPGLWEAVGYTSSNTAKFVADTGVNKVHRRGLYTFWKRTAAPPQMTTFDAPSREACTVRRERTNTPLQALQMMNEPQMVEAARALAERVLREGGSTDEDRATYLFRLATARRPDAPEQAELLAALQELRSHYASDVEAAKRLIAIGETKPSPGADPSVLAAWTMLANTVLNLDEVITRG